MPFADWERGERVAAVFFRYLFSGILFLSCGARVVGLDLMVYVLGVGVMGSGVGVEEVQ